MAEKTDVKAEALPDLDDLLQCPVCYEIPSGQIFQCNEGHHVCGRCKARLSQCPVCRALFFGTRNYAMEELIANVRKLRAFKLGGKVTTGSSGSGSNTPAEDAASGDQDNNPAEDEDNASDQNLPPLRAPQACKGLFRCLCCKNGNSIRLPAARLLNHLRYFHSPELIEGQSENGEYVQAWQFSTVPGRIVTAVRVSDMGIFFLIIEISNESVHAWLSMAAAPWVTNEFSYTVTISGNDREAIFSDCVWSVRSCEGFLKKRGRCLVVTGLDARALVAPATISGKLSVTRVRPDDAHQHLQHPRAVLRVASRGGPRDLTRDAAQLLDPFIQHLENNVARLSRALDREIRDHTPAVPPVAPPPVPAPEPRDFGLVAAPPTLSRNARRRMRNRLRATLNEAQDVNERGPAQNNSGAQRTNGHVSNNVLHATTGYIQVVPAPAAQRTNAQSSTNSNARNNGAPNNPMRIQTGLAIVQPSPPSAAPAARQTAQSQRNVAANSVQIQTGLAIVQNQAGRGGNLQGGDSVPRANPAPAPAAAPAPGPAAPAPGPAAPASGPSNGQQSQNTNRNKKKRRHRR
ncbi:uncharacterized protein LOC125241698 [Leguminivora glycinivorella]|uniref:uncharacterized protein LOC125241698 n=1 Tax=Leguminivora glycinivorella TaxID=1035111 RepID=UPI00200FEDAA|nr:uncharacterized protein LOC125241698 [Leguminivora glycinivorella]